jgi:hypothetical protein
MEKTFKQVLSDSGRTIQENFPALFLSGLIFAGILYGISLLLSVLYYFVAMMGGFEVPAWINVFSVVITVLPWVFLSPLYTGFVAAVIHKYFASGKKTPFYITWKYAVQNYKKYLFAILAALPFSFGIGCLFRLVDPSVGITTAFNISVFPSMFESGMMNGLFSYYTANGILILAIGLVYSLCVMGMAYIPECEGKSGFGAFFESLRYVVFGRFARNLAHFLFAPAIICTIVFVINYVLPGQIAAIMMSPDAWDIAQVNLILNIIQYASLLLISPLLNLFYQSWTYQIYQNARISAGENGLHMRRAAKIVWGHISNKQ